MRPIAFNGKFLAASPTGVHRVAGELIRQVDSILAADGASATGGSWDLVQPKDARSDLALTRIRTRQVGRLVWQPWEQLELPLFTRDAMLVSLCNLAPLAHPRSICMIHDAQVFLSPQSYSRSFRSWYQFALPRIGANALRVLTVSHYSAAMLVKYGVADQSKIDVIHNGIDHLGRVPSDVNILYKLALKRPFVVALSTVQAHKNISLLIEAFRDPMLSGIRLVLVGAAGERDFEVCGIKTGSNITFTGKVTDGEMRALFEAASALAFPSRTEGFGLPPLEAMYFGCPAIVAPCGALPEVCEDAVDYADPDDASAWAAGIARLVNDPAHAARQREAGIRQAAKFRWKKSGERLLEVINAAR